MKKFLIIFTILPILSLFAFYGLRFIKNPAQITPYPFIIKDKQNISIDAPILIIGDQLAGRLAQFKEKLAQKISSNLVKDIKIESIATDNYSAARVLHQIKSLSKLPLIIIYLGNNSERYEDIFLTSQINQINRNFKLSNNKLYKSIIMVEPSLSRFLYSPIEYKELGPKLIKDTNNYSDIAFQYRSIVHFNIYESILNDLLSYIRKNNAYLIPITTPINYSAKKYKACRASFDQNSQELLDDVKKYIQMKDYKAAYNLSKDLVSFNPLHAPSLNYHSQIARGLNYFQEAQIYMERAITYDCSNHLSSPVFNQILRKTANKFNLSYVDFSQLVLDQSFYDVTFLDEIYPQDIYFEKLTTILAVKIKKLLKL